MGLKQVVNPNSFNVNIAIHVQYGQPFQKLLFSVLVVVNGAYTYTIAYILRPFS